MVRAQVEIGGTYRAKVSDKRVTVKIEGPSPYGGWNAINLETGRTVRIKTAGRLSPVTK